MGMLDRRRWFSFKYQDGNWEKCVHEFPVSIEYYDFIEKHLGYTDFLIDDKGQNRFDIYSKEEKWDESGSFEYLIVLNVFEYHTYFVECSDFIQLMKALKELQPLNDINIAYNTKYEDEKNL